MNVHYDVEHIHNETKTITRKPMELAAAALAVVMGMQEIAAIRSLTNERVAGDVIQTKECVSVNICKRHAAALLHVGKSFCHIFS